MIFCYYKKLLNPEMLGLHKDLGVVNPFDFLLAATGGSPSSYSLVPFLGHLLTGVKYHEITSDQELSDLVDLGLTGIFVSPGGTGSAVVSDDVYIRGGPQDGEITVSGQPLWSEHWYTRSMHTVETVDEQFLFMYHPFVPNSTVTFTSKASAKLYAFPLNRVQWRSDNWLWTKEREYTGIDSETGKHVFTTTTRATMSNETFDQYQSGEPTLGSNFAGRDEDCEAFERVIVEHYHLAGFLLGNDHHFVASVAGATTHNAVGMTSATGSPTPVSPGTVEFMVGTHMKPFDTDTYLTGHFDIWRDNVDAGLSPEVVWGIRTDASRRQRARSLIPVMPTHIGKSHIIGRDTVETDRTPGNQAKYPVTVTRDGTYFAHILQEADVGTEANLVSAPGSSSTSDAGFSCIAYVSMDLKQFGSTKLVMRSNGQDYFPPFAFFDDFNGTAQTNSPIDYSRVDRGAIRGNLPGDTYASSIAYPVHDPVSGEWTDSADWKWNNGVPTHPNVPHPDPNAPGTTQQELDDRQAVITTGEDATARWMAVVLEGPPSILQAREIARYNYVYPLLS